MGLFDLLSRLWRSEPRSAPRREPVPVEDEEADVDPFDPFKDPSAFPVRDVIDLHGLPPKMVPEVVESYLEEARRLRFRHVRIVHGKGIGVQREVVRKILARIPWVEAFADAPPEAGGWGATVARLALEADETGEIEP